MIALYDYLPFLDQILKTFSDPNRKSFEKQDLPQKTTHSKTSSGSIISSENFAWNVDKSGLIYCLKKHIISA